MPAYSPLESGCFVALACYLGCVLSLFIPDPCMFMATEVFSCQFGSVHLRGSHLGGCPFWFPFLGPAPLVECVAGSPPFVFLSALRVPCSIAGVRCFSWCLRFSRFARSSRTGCLALFFFLRPLLFRFYLFRIPWLWYWLRQYVYLYWTVSEMVSMTLLCLPGSACLGVYSPPWPSLAGFVSVSWGVLGRWILVFKFLGLSFIPFASRCHGLTVLPCPLGVSFPSPSPSGGVALCSSPVGVALGRACSFSGPPCPDPL